jgi:hypothetical protein
MLAHCARFPHGRAGACRRTAPRTWNTGPSGAPYNSLPRRIRARFVAARPRDRRDAASAPQLSPDRCGANRPPDFPQDACRAHGRSCARSTGTTQPAPRDSGAGKSQSDKLQPCWAIRTRRRSGPPDRAPAPPAGLAGDRRRITAERRAERQRATAARMQAPISAGLSRRVERHDTRVDRTSEQRLLCRPQLSGPHEDVSLRSSVTFRLIICRRIA